jgi:hypothetical protein
LEIFIYKPERYYEDGDIIMSQLSLTFADRTISLDDFVNNQSRTISSVAFSVKDFGNDPHYFVGSKGTEYEINPNNITGLFDNQVDITSRAVNIRDYITMNEKNAHVKMSVLQIPYQGNLVGIVVNDLNGKLTFCVPVQGYREMIPQSIYKKE